MIGFIYLFIYYLRLNLLLYLKRNDAHVTSLKKGMQFKKYKLQILDEGNFDNEFLLFLRTHMRTSLNTDKENYPL